MLRFLPLVIALMLLVYCLADCVQTDRAGVQTLPKWGWLLIVVGVPILGPVAWLFFGRPARGYPARTSSRGSHQPGGPTRPVARGPEDDPAFLATLDRRAVERSRADERRRPEQPPEPDRLDRSDPQSGAPDPTDSADPSDSADSADSKPTGPAAGPAPGPHPDDADEPPVQPAGER